MSYVCMYYVTYVVCINFNPSFQFFKTREMAPFGGLSLALWGWEVFQKQTDRIKNDIGMFGRTNK